MAKARKQAAAPSAAPMPRLGDKVTPPRSEMVYTITALRDDGKYVDLAVPDMNLQRFHVDVSTLTFVDRAPAPPAKQASLFDADTIAERIATVQRENLERLDDDLDILTRFLKSEGAPTAALNALDSLRSQQRGTWEDTITKIKELFEE